MVYVCMYECKSVIFALAACNGRYPCIQSLCSVLYSKHYRLRAMGAKPV